MLKHYLTLAWRVLWRRRFFTAISLFGISLTLVVLMVATALLDHTFAPMAPEVRQDRTLVIFNAHAGRAELRPGGTAPGSSCSTATPGTWPNVERMAMVDVSRGGVLLPRRHARAVVAAARRRGVLAHPGLRLPRRRPVRGSGRPERLARRRHQRRHAATGSSAAAPAVGRWIDADGQRFRVVGVVANVSASQAGVRRRHLRPVHDGEDGRLQDQTARRLHGHPARAEPRRRSRHQGRVRGPAEVGADARARTTSTSTRRPKPTSSPWRQTPSASARTTPATRSGSGPPSSARRCCSCCCRPSTW